MRKAAASVCMSILALSVVWAAAPVPPYKDEKLPIEQRVSDLLKRMTLEEKVDQISGGHHYQILDSTGQYKPEEADNIFKKMYSNESNITPHDAAVIRNAAQRYEMEKSRLGIPDLFMGEGLHGFMETGSTSFPQALGLASSWDPPLVNEVFTAVGDEMSAAGINQSFSPVIDLARDPRWGRTEETFGEDPYLVSRMGVAAIRGLQGADLRSGVVATGKHFVGYGASEGGLNWAPVHVGARELPDVYLH